MALKIDFTAYDPEEGEIMIRQKKWPHRSSPPTANSKLSDAEDIAILYR